MTTPDTETADLRALPDDWRFREAEAIMRARLLRDAVDDFRDVEEKAMWTRPSREVNSD